MYKSSHNTELNKFLSLIGKSALAKACFLSESAISRWVERDTVPLRYHNYLLYLADKLKIGAPASIGGEGLKPASKLKAVERAEQKAKELARGQAIATGLEALGGIKAVAKERGLCKEAVAYWRKVGYIPRRHRQWFHNALLAKNVTPVDLAKPERILPKLDPYLK